MLGTTITSGPCVVTGSAPDEDVRPAVEVPVGCLRDITETLEPKAANTHPTTGTLSASSENPSIVFVNSQDKK